MKSLLKSRKFWLTIVGIGLPVVNKKFGLEIPPEQVVAAIMSIVVLIGSIAYEDGKQKEADKAGKAAEENK